MDEWRAPEVIESPVARTSILVGIAVSLWLAFSSIDSVPPLHHGIRYNLYNKYVETDHVYGPGRYFVGPWNEFMLFPGTARTIEFTNEVMLKQLGTRYEPLHTRTKEGLALHMKVSVQYVLDEKLIGELYKEFSHDYESFFVSQMRNTLIQVAAEYEAQDFWVKREAIGKDMRKSLSATLRGTYADCWGFQLMTIELPAEYDQAIVSTQVVQQTISLQEFAQIATQIRAETKVIEAEYAKKVKIIKAYGLANKSLTIRTSKAKAKSASLNADASVMEQVKERLQLEPPSLVEYQEYTAVSLLKNATLFFGFDDTSGLIMQPQASSAQAAESPKPVAAPAAPADDNAQLRRLVGREL